MSVADSFFDLSKEGIAELGIKISETDEGCRVDSNAGELFEIINCTGTDEHRDAALYSAFVCQAYHVGERETRALLNTVTDSTIGYVFPITAFRDRENFDGMWLRRFADVGFRYATTFDVLAKFTAGVSIESLRNRRLFLDQVFDDTLSIVVLGNSERHNLAVDLDTLELMLLKQGIGILRSPTEVLPEPVSLEWSSKIRLAKPGPLVEREAAVFLSLLKSADRDHVGIGAFMHLYQGLEFCIDHIFGWSVSKIAREKIDTWEMKDRLSKITGEQHRLSLLDSECLANLPTRDSLHDLAECCRVFLTALNVDFDDESSWHRLLYKSRNIIVHNQIVMMKAPNVPLRDLVSALRTASMEILFSFTIPAIEEFQ